MIRLHSVILLFLSILCYTGIAGSDTHDESDEPSATGMVHLVPQTFDLYSDALLAQEQKLPILLVFTADDCDYCILLEREILNPMVLSGNYQQKVIIRRVLIDNFDLITDFNGKKVESVEFANAFNVNVTPTVMLLNSKGTLLAPKILGINTVEFYGGYLDIAIDHSLAVVKNTL